VLIARQSHGTQSRRDHRARFAGPCQAAPLSGERTSGLPELRVGPSLTSDPTLALSAIWILALFDCTTAKIVPPGKRRSTSQQTRRLNGSHAS
jgi:hypothetical protein